MIVYTANYGGKNKFKEPKVEDSWSKDLKLVYFTDQPFESDVWDVVIEKKTGDSHRLAKWYKINSHELFPGEPTLWLDASIKLKEDPTRFLHGWDNILVRTHRNRQDVYEEAAHCIKYNKDVKGTLESQVTEYKRQEFPEKSGLYINGILFRKPTEDTTRLNKAWWEQICKYSSRDQISLPYVLHAQNIEFKEVEHLYFENCFTSAGRHIFRGTKEIT